MQWPHLATKLTVSRQHSSEVGLRVTLGLLIEVITYHLQLHHLFLVQWFQLSSELQLRTIESCHIHREIFPWAGWFTVMLNTIPEMYYILSESSSPFKNVGGGGGGGGQFWPLFPMPMD